MLRKLGIGFIALATMAPGLAAALGVGEYELNSYLNEPLDMTVELHDLGGLSEDEILANLATQEAFDAAGVDRGYFLNDLKFEVDVSGDSGVLHIRSRQPVREPYLNFLVEFLWPTGRLMREYTVLLDPPSYADDGDSLQPAVSEPSPRPATRPEPASEPARQRPAEPATRPQSRPAPSEASGDGAGEVAERDTTTYRVGASDTMWRIARQQRPSPDVSVQQMMLAIQERNPDAFINDNVNLVREGAVLRIPSEQQVRRVSSREALSRVATQNREWRGMRPEPAAGQPQRAPIDATGRDRSDQVAGGDDGQGQVTLVSPDSEGGVRDGDATGGRSGDADTAALQNELAIRDENLDRLNRENSELRSRLDALDEQVSTSQQLLEMRSEKIAALQAELRRLREEQDLDVDPSLLEEPEPAADSAPDMTADTGGADSGGAENTDGTDSADAAGDQPAAVGDDDDAAPVLGAPGQNGGGDGPSPDQGGGGDDRTATVTPPEKPEPASADQAGSGPANADQADSGGGIVGLIRDNLLYVGAALAVLLLLLLLALRRRQNAAGDEHDEEDDNGFGDDFEAPVMAGTAAHDDADLEEDLADDEMDPMERADVYVAYGQYPQAVDFLRNEINQAPERGDLKIRLLELLHESNDERGFHQQATAFAGTSPAVDAAIKRLGGDPGEHDYGDNAYVASNADSGDDELSLDDLELDLASDLSDQPDDSDGYSHAATATAAGAGAAAGFAAGREQSDQADTEQPETEQTDQDDSLELDDFDFTLEDEEPENRPLRDETPLELDDLVLDDGNDRAGDDEDDGLAFSLEDDFESDGDVTFTDDELAALDSAETPAGNDDGDTSTERGADDLGDFDDLELDDLDVSLTDDRTGVDEPAPAPAEASSGEDTGDELADLSLEDDDTELSLDDLSLEDDAPSSPRTEPDAGADDLDDLNLELDDAGEDDAPAAEYEPEPQTAATPPADTSEVSDDMLGDDDDFDFLGETDENATKLDLARAYIDMGDAEGARDILNEVLSEGSEEQQGEAKELLARVG
ncbi:MAG: FimV/HubP family polar landmark protein [Pseudomonadota bacterium]|nr:FimV/HubP family polar landmark protein [Pseudomonadota bacterium]|tara:strand:- start:49548 stop:52664 length:3117 start_codon:yes stop_codon:yes gene_type:complete